MLLPGKVLATVLILSISINSDGARNKVIPTSWRAQSAPKARRGDRGLWKIGSETVGDRVVKNGCSEILKI